METEKIHNLAESKEELLHFKIELPARDGVNKHNCLQTSTGMILDGWKKEGAPDYKELDKISHRREGMGSWPGWLVSWLSDSGYGIDFYSKFDWEKFSEQGEDYLKSEEFRQKHETETERNFADYLKRHVVEDGIASAKEMEERGLIKTAEITLGEIFERIKNGERGMFLLDGDHWVPVTGFDGQKVYYNNPSGESVELNREKELKDFEKKWNRFNLNTVLLIRNKE
ncbi:hypothetical protein KJ866_03940 [Patescibacteria group bacterium]|nr:hypothetical protein [Patescibacteria group bacterium]MBU2264922.1 hypothetical protein [Patescibacteria group bacterium]